MDLATFLIELIKLILDFFGLATLNFPALFS